MTGDGFHKEFVIENAIREAIQFIRRVVPAERLEGSPWIVGQLEDALRLTKAEESEEARIRG